MCFAAHTAETHAQILYYTRIKHSPVILSRFVGLNLISQLLVEQSLPVQPCLKFGYSPVDRRHFLLSFGKNLALLYQPGGLLFTQLVPILYRKKIKKKKLIHSDFKGLLFRYLFKHDNVEFRQLKLLILVLYVNSNNKACASITALSTKSRTQHFSETHLSVFLTTFS